jgi:transcriptional regulator with XRE-family HTH domain
MEITNKPGRRNLNMSATLCPVNDLNNVNVVPPTGPAKATPTLHQLQKVRQREEISLRSAARRLGMSAGEVKAQEMATDLPISVLHRWAAALEVPIAELLVEPPSELSLPLLTRARLVRIMKTTRAIGEQTKQIQIKRLAQTLADQLIEIMPELAGVTAWNSGISRRNGVRELGRAADFIFRLPTDEYTDPPSYLER